MCDRQDLGGSMTFTRFVLGSKGKGLWSYYTSNHGIMQIISCYTVNKKFPLWNRHECFAFFILSLLQDQ